MRAGTTNPAHCEARKTAYMLVNCEIAIEFLEKYKLIMKWLNRGVAPKGLKKYVRLREKVYDRLDDIETAVVDSIDAEFVNALRHTEYGKFAYLKKYRDGYAFYSLKNCRYYAVLALTTPFEELIEEYCIVETALYMTT